MPTLLFGCLCLFDFQGLIQLFENLRLLKRLAISFTHQHRMSIEPFITYWEIYNAYVQLFFQKKSHPYDYSGAYNY